MKALNKLSWLEKLFLLAAVLLALSDLSLAFLRNRAQAQEKVVEEAVAEKSSQVGRLRVDMDVAQLNRQLEEVRARLEADPFPKENPGPRLEELILTADQVTMRDVALGVTGTKKMGGREYSAIISHVVCGGQLSSLVSYMRGLVDGPFSTLYLDNVSLSQGEAGWEASFDIVLLIQEEGA